MDIEVRRSGCGCGGCVTSVLGTAFAAGMTLLLLGIVFAMPRGGSDEVLAAMAQCPAVTSAMGTPLHVSRLSLGCGEESSGGGSGSAQWTISVAGPRQGASVSYVATYLGNEPWTVQRATVSLDDGTSVSAVPCEGGGEAAPRVRPVRDERGGKGGKRR